MHTGHLLCAIVSPSRKSRSSRLSLLSSHSVTKLFSQISILFSYLLPHLFICIKTLCYHSLQSSSTLINMFSSLNIFMDPHHPWKQNKDVSSSISLVHLSSISPHLCSTQSKLFQSNKDAIASLSFVHLHIPRQIVNVLKGTKYLSSTAQQLSEPPQGA